MAERSRNDPRHTSGHRFAPAKPLGHIVPEGVLEDIFENFATAKLVYFQSGLVTSDTRFF